MEEHRPKSSMDKVRESTIIRETITDIPDEVKCGTNFFAVKSNLKSIRRGSAASSLKSADRSMARRGSKDCSLY